MDFNAGEHVVHRAYGPGEIVLLEEKELAGKKALYYVFRVGELTIWVPASAQESLRPVTPAGEFERLFEILRSTPQPLPEDRFERKLYLSAQLKTGSLESFCSLLRDLTAHRKVKKANDQDNAAFELAVRLLVAEWEVALAEPQADAERKLHALLSESLAKSHITK